MFAVGKKQFWLTYVEEYSMIDFLVVFGHLCFGLVQAHICFIHFSRFTQPVFCSHLRRSAKDDYKEKATDLCWEVSLRIQETRPVKDLPATKSHQSQCLLRRTMPLHQPQTLQNTRFSSVKNHHRLYLDQTRCQHH